jgi:hypothetical protein
MVIMHRHLVHVNSRIRKLMSTSSASFSPFLALLTVQVVVSVWLLSSGAIGGPLFSLLGVNLMPPKTPSDPVPSYEGVYAIKGANLIPPQMDVELNPSLIGVLSLIFSILLIFSVLHIGYDLEQKKVHLDETCLIGAVCGLLLGIISLVLPTVLLLLKLGSAGLLVIAPVVVTGSFAGILFGLILASLGALTKRYVLSKG